MVCLHQYGTVPTPLGEFCKMGGATDQADQHRGPTPEELQERSQDLKDKQRNFLKNTFHQELDKS